jgi:hypothetical protein
MTDAKDELRVEKSPQFRVEYIDGIAGGINTQQDIAWMQFYTDNPNVKYDSKGIIISTEVVRNVVIDIRMALKTFESISKFMEEQIKKHESGKKGTEKTK